MTLVEHLFELRSRLLRAGLAYALGVAAAYVLWQPIYDVLRHPYCQVAGTRQCTLYVYGIFDQFQVRMRVAFIGGAVLSSPVWLYQLGAFITPALHRTEKRYAAGFLAAALALFAVGAGFAYLTLSHGLRLLLHVAGDNVTNLPSLKSYLSFVTLILMLFGLAFEFPVVVVFLNVTGVLSFDRMRAWRRGMYFALFAAAAVLTPTTDPFTFVALGIPLCLLYEACVLIARVRARAQRRKDAADPLHALADDAPSALDVTPSTL
ncbi:MAG: twin-arginine translocase subunit TatC [Actinomycetota bacterium]|nr:twin-arginine translocase subunit TatC [Actinomycetota bacterium]